MTPRCRRLTTVDLHYNPPPTVPPQVQSLGGPTPCDRSATAHSDSSLELAATVQVDAATEVNFG